MKKPIINIVHNPTPHIVIDNFFNKFEDMSSMARELYPYAIQGSHDGEIIEGLNRKELYLHVIPELTDSFTNLLIKEFWTDQRRRWWDTMPMPFSLLNNTTHSSLLLGFYGNDGRYVLHHDFGLITIIMYLHKEKNFSGGELVLTNRKMHYSFNEKDEQVVIDCLPNRLVMFPSCYLHGVNPIVSQGLENDINNMRVALSYFIGFKEQP